ncbi:MAG: class GN sortase [Acidobacteriota bacterium]
MSSSLELAELRLTDQLARYWVRRRVASGLAPALILTGLAMTAWGAYLPAKAGLGQHLLQQAWERAQITGVVQRPWPWAQTWPVARLRAPAHGIDQIVLEGADGESMAWAPGRVSGSANLRESAGNVALAGHRDTHFAFLRDLVPGDVLVLSDIEGRRRSYRVEETLVVDQTAVEVLGATSEATLTLITCYPFDAVRPGGPLRYVVRAVAD